VIDKVDLRIPGTANWQRGFKLAWGVVSFQGQSVPLRTSKFYQAVADLRPLGLDALLHACYRFGRKRDHKLELLETSKKSLAEMAAIANAIFEVETGKVLIVRLDLAADIPDIPVEYLRQSLRVQRKRKTDEWGVIEYEAIGDRRVQYLRYGRSPNLIRAYDKVAEWKARFSQILRRVSPDAEVPKFEQTFGFPENATLTRVERQMGGGRLPPQLATFGSLENAATFDPFSAVEIIPRGIPVPDPQHYGPAEMVKIIGIHAMIEREGYQNAFALLNRDHNAKRLMEPYLAFKRDCAHAFEIDRARLTEIYRQSVRKQISGGANTWANPQVSRVQEKSK
jgi:hypothetical protein